jgi:ankyrin repeat protein
MRIINLFLRDALHKACRDNRKCNILLFIGCDINGKDKNGNRPLYYAIKNGHLGIIRFLIEKSNKGKINLCTESIDESTQSAAKVAIRYDQLDMLKLFEEYNNEGSKEKSYIKAHPELLQQAIVSERTEIVKYLIDNGADVNFQDSQGKSALHFAFDKLRPNSEIIKILLDTKDINVSLTDKDGMTFLHRYVLISCENSDAVAMKERLDLLVGYKIDLNQRDKLGKTPLHYAVSYQTRYVIEKLLTIGCDINSQDNNGNTVLHLLIKSHRSWEAVELLLKYQPNLRMKTCDGKTAYDIYKSIHGKDIPSYQYSSFEKMILILKPEVSSEEDEGEYQNYRQGNYNEIKKENTLKIPENRQEFLEKEASMYDHIEPYWDKADRMVQCRCCGKLVAIKIILVGSHREYIGSGFYDISGTFQSVSDYDYLAMPHFKPGTTVECSRGVKPGNELYPLKI